METAVLSCPPATFLSKLKCAPFQLDVLEVGVEWTGLVVLGGGTFLRPLPNILLLLHTWVTASRFPQIVLLAHCKGELVVPVGGKVRFQGWC